MPQFSRASARLGRLLDRQHFRRRAVCRQLLSQSAAAQTQTGKELTVDRLFRAPSLGGRLTQGIEWAPDGKRFSYLDRQGYGKDAVTQLWTMDASTGERKVLVNAETLKSVMQPEKAKTSQATGLGRVQAGQLFVVARRKFPALHRQQQPGAARSEDDDTQASTQQRTRNRRSEILAGFPLDQFLAQRESFRC